MTTTPKVFRESYHHGAQSPGTIRTTTPTMLGRTTVPQRLQNDYTSAPALLGEAVLGRGLRGLQSPGLLSSSPDNTDMAAEKDQQKDAEAEGPERHVSNRDPEVLWSPTLLSGGPLGTRLLDIRVCLCCPLRGLRSLDPQPLSPLEIQEPGTIIHPRTPESGSPVLFLAGGSDPSRSVDR